MVKTEQLKQLQKKISRLQNEILFERDMNMNDTDLIMIINGEEDTYCLGNFTKSSSSILLNNARIGLARIGRVGLKKFFMSTFAAVYLVVHVHCRFHNLKL